MKASTKQERLGTSGVAEASPHQVRASVYYQRPRRVRVKAEHNVFAATRNTWKPGAFKDRPGVRNATVAALRALAGGWPKQTGRTFGPAIRPKPKRGKSSRPKGATKLFRKHGFIVDEAITWKDEQS